MFSRRSFALACAAALTPRPGFTQSWPPRQMKIIVPFTPGGASDVIARVVATTLGEIHGRQVIIEHKGGAGGNVGSEYVARSDPDGSTMLLAPTSVAINKFLYESITFDALTDFAPVTLICFIPNIMVVPNSSPARTVREFIDYAKAKPGGASFASAGAGSALHLSGELFKRMAGIEMTHVPYRGGGQAISDLIPGRVDVMFNAMASTLPLVEGGQLRALAVTTMKRVPVIPDVPTIDEAALPGFDVSSYFSLIVAAKTPPEIVTRLNADLVAALKTPLAKTALEKLGALVVGSSPEELGALMRATHDKWGPIIREAGIKAAD